MLFIKCDFMLNVKNVNISTAWLLLQQGIIIVLVKKNSKIL